MSVGAGIAIAGIWIAVAVSAFGESGAVGLVAFLAMLATAAIARNDG